MNTAIKTILQKLGLYHPLQSSYRHVIRYFLRKRYQKDYQPFAGSGFTCNICGSLYSRFVPDKPSVEDAGALERHQVIAGYGDNIICPNCLSTARERLVIACLEKYMHPAGKSILHFSPEPAVYSYLHGQAKLVTADLIPGFYRHIDPHIRKEDATCISFPDQSFDIVIANHVLEHISNDRAAMRECYRVLKPGGMAVLQVPYSEILKTTMEAPGICDPAKQSALYGQHDHVRIYAFSDYIERLMSAGFQVSYLPMEERAELDRFAVQPHEQFLLIKKPD